MKQKEIIWQSKVQADIFSPDFYEQLGLENAELPPAEQPFYYNLDVTISLATSQMEDKIESYCYLHPIHQRITDKKDKYGAILGEQINEVLQLFREIGYALKDVRICAEPMENPQEVTLALSKGPDTEKTNSEWSIAELKSGLEAQYELERIWKHKTTHMAFVLHNLQSVSYTLLGKQEHGYLKISKLEATRYPALRVIWDNEIT